MSRKRTSIEPVGRFAVLVIAVHLVLGAGLWWWLRSAPEAEPVKPSAAIVWSSPSEVAAQVTPPVVELPVVAVAPTPPAPMPVVEEEPSAPKAIAIDLNKALELMAKAEAAEAVKAAAASTPPPAPEPAKPAGSEAAMKTTPVPLPTAEPEPPPLPKPDPKPVMASTEPEPPPLPATNGSRFITISHPKQAKARADQQSVTLLDFASLDAGATGALSADRVEPVDRATKTAFNQLWSPPDPATLSADHRDVSLNLTLNREGRILKYKLAKNSGSSELDISVIDAADRLNKIEAVLPADYPHEEYEFTVNFHVE